MSTPAPMVLDAFKAVTLDASGNGQVQFSPESFRSWTVTTINVRTDQAPTVTPIPRVQVYTDVVADGNLKAQSWMGNGTTATGSLYVQSSQLVIVRWTGGVPSSRATASLYGTMAMR